MLFCFIAALYLFTVPLKNFYLYIFKVNIVFILKKRHEPFLIHSMKYNSDCVSLFVLKVLITQIVPARQDSKIL